MGLKRDIVWSLHRGREQQEEERHRIRDSNTRERQRGSSTEGVMMSTCSIAPAVSRGLLASLLPADVSCAKRELPSPRHDVRGLSMMHVVVLQG